MISPRKRRFPTPEEMAQLFKRPRVEPLDAALPRIPIPPDPLVLRKLSFSGVPKRIPAPVLHSIPSDAVPILEPPYTVADFFSDVKKQTPQAEEQHAAAASSFPPPPPPPVEFLSRKGKSAGVMVPFVYPALPVFKYDPWTVYPEKEGKREEKRERLSEKEKEGERERSGEREKRVSRRLERLDASLSFKGSGSSEISAASEPDMFPVMAPLPFPPPNFMPYPLVADQAPLTPNDVFSQWIEASKNLPRVDMVLASAAGSIYDMHSQAVEENLSTGKLDELLRLGCLDRDVRTAPSYDGDSSFEEYMAYANNVDTRTVEDPFAKPMGDSLVVHSDMRNEALQVGQQTSKNGEIESLEKDGEDDGNKHEKYVEIESDPPIPSLDFPSGKDLVMASGVQRGRRRQALAKMVGDIELHEHIHRDEIYAHRNQQLLAKLRSLQNTKISFDNDPADIKDPELRYYVEQRQVQRDEELVRLKATFNYEKLKNILNFYQTSHRLYKAMTTTMVNKLQKLRNFFDHQRQMLANATKNPDADAKSMRSRESEKLYSGFIEQEYGNEIKEEFRLAIAKEDGKPLDQNKKFDSSLFKKVYKGHQHAATVEDYMPLVTKEEFKLITGDAPAKTVSKDAGNKNKSARHQIFQSSLYDRATSGSDSETPTTKRRPGRRAAPKPTYGEEAKVSNDAALVAKIMKQFVGPASANSEELMHDLDKIGIETKWPVK